MDTDRNILMKVFKLHSISNGYWQYNGNFDLFAFKLDFLFSYNLERTTLNSK